MFDEEKIIAEKVVVHCSTKEEAQLLLTWADMHSHLWSTGERYIDNSEWDGCRGYYEKTCYYLAAGTYSDAGHFKDRGFKVLTFDEAKLPESKRDLEEAAELRKLAKWARFPLQRNGEKADPEIKAEITSEVKNLLDELVVEEQNLLGQPMTGSIVNKNEIAEKIALLFFCEAL